MGAQCSTNYTSYSSGGLDNSSAIFLKFWFFWQIYTRYQSKYTDKNDIDTCVYNWEHINAFSNSIIILQLYLALCLQETNQV